MRKTIAGVVAGCAPGVRRPGAGPGEAHRLVGQGLLQVRGRRAVRGDQEVRGQEQERQDRAVAVPGPGHDPEDGGRARFRQPARRRLRRRLRLPGHRQVGLRGQARGRHQRHRPAARASSSRTRCRPPSSTTTRPRAAPTTPSRSSSRRCTSSTGRTCSPRPASRRRDIPTTWKEYWCFWCDKVQPAYRQKTGNRAFGIGQPMGVDSSDSFYLVPDLHGRLQRQAGQRQRQAAGRRPDGAPGPDRRADRLHRASTPRAARRRRRRAGRTRTTTSPSTTRRRC